MLPGPFGDRGGHGAAMSRFFPARQQERRFLPILKDIQAQRLCERLQGVDHAVGIKGLYCRKAASIWAKRHGVHRIEIGGLNAQTNRVPGSMVSRRANRFRHRWA